MVQSFWKTLRQLLMKLNVHSPYNPMIQYLSIYPNETKTDAHVKTCRKMFIAALLRITKTWKQSRTSPSRRMNKQTAAHSYTGTLVINKKGTNLLLIYTTTWMNREVSEPSQVSQTQKRKFWMIPFIWNPGKAKIIGTVADQRLSEAGDTRKSFTW